MENKLKVLSAYLPYKLKLKTPYGFRPNGKESTGISRVAYLTGDLYADLENKTFEINEFKPILFPLEDLTKPITLYGETFVPIEKIYDWIGWDKEELKELIPNGTILGIYSDNDLIPFSHALKLLEWKFNVFNLPEDEYVKVTKDFNPYE